TPTVSSIFASIWSAISTSRGWSFEMIRLDTQHNLLSVGLIAAIILVAVAGLLAALLMGRPDVADIRLAALENPAAGSAVTRNRELPEFSTFEAVLERPVFFEDRSLPVVERVDEGAEEPEQEEQVAAVEIPELEASVAGIIISPEVKLAMITDNSTRNTQILREGMTLQGDKSAWKVTEIQAREVRFATDGGRSRKLELEIETGALATGAPPPRRQTAQAETQQLINETDSTEGDAEAEARARAEEIRRRVAERRAQLRAEAERRAREAQGNNR
ncbi:MAG: hypothetical protein ACPGJE_06075, partial [Wenzhouxiangellaceae bacterium]